MRFKFQAHYLPILARFAAKQDIRYYMNGIRVERANQGLYLVATDGSSMVVIHDVQGVMVGDQHPGAIRITSGLVAAAKAKTSLPQFVVLDGHRLSVAPDFDMNHSELEMFVQAGKPLVDGLFPDWRRVAPDFSKLLPGSLTDGGGVNANYLARFAGLDKKFHGIALWRSPEDGKALIVQVAALQELLGIVMPMRIDAPSARHKMLTDHFQTGEAAPAKPPQHVPV